MYLCINCCPEERCNRGQVEDLVVIYCSVCGKKDICCDCHNASLFSEVDPDSAPGGYDDRRDNPYLYAREL